MVLDERAEVNLGFKPLETAGRMRFAPENTFIVKSNKMIFPNGVTVGSMEYPSLEEVVKQVEVFTKNISADAF